MDEKVFQIVMFVATVVIGITGWFFKRNLDHLDDNDKELSAEIKSVHKEMTDYKLEASREFATKDEFVRVFGSLDKKLDKIYEEVLRQKSEKREGNG